jgi:hypothetical protein
MMLTRRGVTERTATRCAHGAGIEGITGGLLPWMSRPQLIVFTVGALIGNQRVARTARRTS